MLQGLKGAKTNVGFHDIDVACQFTLYNGWGCPAGAVNAVTDVPAGSDSVCAFAGVYDGGACSYCVKRSATYTCA